MRRQRITSSIKNSIWLKEANKNLLMGEGGWRKREKCVRFRCWCERTYRKSSWKYRKDSCTLHVDRSDVVSLVNSMCVSASLLAVVWLVWWREDLHLFVLNLLMISTRWRRSCEALQSEEVKLPPEESKGKSFEFLISLCRCCSPMPSHEP